MNVPENPVIGARAFGDDAAKVARHVAAFVRGTQAAGVAACAKHFPGHGATTQDSHLELPTLDGSTSRPGWSRSARRSPPASARS